MNKTVKNLINKTIELEYYHMDSDITELQHFDDYKEVSDKYGDIQRNVYKTLPAEYHKLIDELVEVSNLLTGTEKKYMFKQGVIKGLTDLEYLNDDIGIQIAFI